MINGESAVTRNCVLLLLPLMLGCSLLTSVPEPTSIEISPSSKTFTAWGNKVGATHTFKAVVRDQNGAVMPDVYVTWLSANQDIATVCNLTDCGIFPPYPLNEGYVRAQGIGTTTIRALAGTALVIVEESS